MLSLQKQPRYFEKMVRLPNGSLAMVVFEIVEVNGSLKARAVCGKLVGQENTEQKIYALPTHIESIAIIPLKQPLFSYNFLAQKDLSFFSSQITRAPNFA